MSKLTALIIISFFLCVNVTAQDQWRYLPNNGFNHDTTYRIEDVYFTDTLHGIAVTLNDGMFRTNDGGVNWTVINNFYTGYRAVEFLDDGVTGIAGTVNAIGTVFRTTDGGSMWSDISSQIADTASFGGKRMCGLGHFGNNFYGVGWFGGNQAKFYKSADKGVTWQTTYIDTNLATGLVDVHFVSADTGFATGTRRNAGHPGASVILKTADGGNTWAEVFSDTTLAGYVWKIQFVNRNYAVGAIQNIYHRDSVNMIRSLDGGEHWQIIPVGSIQGTTSNMGSTQACGFATPAKGWVGGYYEGLFETLDSGKTWNHINFGNKFNRIFVIDSSHIYAGGDVPYKYGTPVYNSVRRATKGVAAPHTLFPVTPNPARGVVNIKFDLENETNVVIDVINIDSRKIYPLTNTHLNKGHYSFGWDSSNAPAGNYLIWLGNNEVQLTQKFVLLK